MHTQSHTHTRHFKHTFPTEWSYLSGLALLSSFPSLRLVNESALPCQDLETMTMKRAEDNKTIIIWYDNYNSNFLSWLRTLESLHSD